MFHSLLLLLVTLSPRKGGILYLLHTVTLDAVLARAPAEVDVPVEADFPVLPYTLRLQ